MAKKSKAKLVSVENVFDDPEAATVVGSEANLVVLNGNDIELPQEEMLMDQGDADRLREEIKELNKLKDDTYWKLSEKLALASDKKAFKQWGFNTFDAYIQAEFSEDKRKSYYLIQIHKYFNNTLKAMLGEGSEDYKAALKTAKSMGWTKAMKVATSGVIDATNVKDVMETARTSTVKELEVVLKTFHDSKTDEEKEKSIDDNEIKTVKVNFQLFLAQKDDLDRALEIARGMAKEGAKDRSLLSLICQDFLSSHKSGNADEMLGKIQSITGLSIIAVNKDAGKIVFGEDNLSDLLANAGDVVQHEPTVNA